MALNRCESGHYYKSEEHTSCPHCGIPDLQSTPTVAKRIDSELPGGGSVGATPPVHNVGGGRASTVARGGNWEAGNDSGKTIGRFQKQLGVDPVVGWLVCTEGPDRGRDYRVRGGRNFIGRAEHMHIVIRGDSSISRDKHAVLSYEPRLGRFKLIPGDSAGLTYLNGETVDLPVELNAFDTIELGETKLKFVPFCGEGFRWGADEEADGR